MCVLCWKYILKGTNNKIFSGFWLILIVLIAVYSVILKTAKHHARQIRDLENSISSSTSQKNATFSKTDVKIAKMMFLVFGIFYLTYMPANVCLIIRRLIGTEYDIGSLRAIQLATNRLIPLNSAFNPITYLFKDRRFRKCIKHLISRSKSHISFDETSFSV